MHLQRGSENAGHIAALDAQYLTSVPILVLMVHSRCNCRCLMCDIWKTEETRGLDAHSLSPHIADIRQLGVSWVVFSGGEPLMNPGLFALAAALKREGIRLTLLTTGILLRRFSAQVAGLMDEVIVSLDGPRELHDEIRRVPRAYDLLAEGVAAVKNRRPTLPVRARMTIQRANYMALRETAQAAHDLGLHSISYLAVDVTSTAFNRDLVWPVPRQNLVALERQDVPNFEVELESLIRQFKDDISSGFIVESPEKLRALVRHFRAHLGLDLPCAPRCNAPWKSAVIEADGSVRPCFFHPKIGNIHESSLSAALNSAEGLRFRAELDIANNPVCQRCVCSLDHNSTTGGGI